MLVINHKSFFFLLRLPTRSTLFPYTTLFRSGSRTSDRSVVWSQMTSSGSLPSTKNTYELAPFVMSRERSEEHTSELQSHVNLVCRLLLEKKKSEPEH